MNETLTGQLGRAPKWSVANWPVRWKVLAIALVPMVLALAFGGLRIRAELTDADRLRLAADRAELVPKITDYMSALGAALVSAATGGDVPSAKRRYADRAEELRSQLVGTDVAGDVRAGIATLLVGGQGLLDRVVADDIGPREQVTGYAPMLLTAEDVITASVRVDDERIRAQTEALSRAVGARGQMVMQQLLVNAGGELPDAELRTAMMALAGTEPSTLFGVSQGLGVDSPDAKALQQQMLTRMAIISDPEAVLPDNAALRDSIRSTDNTAARVIDTTTAAVTTALADRAGERRHAAIRDSAAIVAAVLTALAVVWLVARSLVRPLRTLRDEALKVAHTDLEQEIARVRAAAPGSEREPAPLPVTTTEEIGQVAHAVDELHAQALLLAGDEARLRLLVNEMFETMARRNRSLLDQQSALVERLERDEDDPQRLEHLLRLEHLAARLRRNGANLLVLADARISADRARPARLSTVISAAVAEVEQPRRVRIERVADVTVAGAVSADTGHLIAELLDNALRYSPPATTVRVSAVATAEGGAALEIVDSGLGMTDADLRIANMRLNAGREVTPESARHMGLFVVNRLSHRHGMRVRLAAASPAGRGISAAVYLPPGLLVADAGAEPDPTPRRAPRHRRGVPVARRDRGEDLIYQGMLSEWLVDPYELGRSPDLDWKSVWDHGWSLAAEVENVPVRAHTEHGLPVREPGARLVPGSAPAQASAPDPTGRDPDAVRSTISSHFGGVHAGRSRSQTPGPVTPERR